MPKNQPESRFFTLPSQFQFGWGCISSLNGLIRDRPFIVTDRPVMERTGHLDRVLNLLHKRDRPPLSIVSVEAEPGFGHIEKTLDLLHKDRADTIIALGGGAVLDTAKAAWYLYANNIAEIDRFFREGPGEGLPGSGREAVCTLIAVPTTSGTGSETTCAVVFIDPNTGLKKVWISPQFVPTAALLDPAMTLTMPQKITASSGFDALTHAVESFLSTTATPFSRAMAREAFLLIMENLAAAYREGGNRPARETMLYASSLAGIAISNSCTGLAHSLDQVGPLTGISHGETLSALFVPVLRVYAETEVPGLAELAQSLEISNGNPPVESLTEAVEELLAELHLPRRFSEKGVSRDRYDAAIEKTIPAARHAFATTTSPIEVSEETMRKILAEAY